MSQENSGIDTLTKVIIPKIIERLKTAEATLSALHALCLDVERKQALLKEDQLRLERSLHDMVDAGKVTTAPKKRASKKKEPELPTLVEQPAAPVEQAPVSWVQPPVDDTMVHTVDMNLVKQIDEAREAQIAADAAREEARKAALLQQATPMPEPVATEAPVVVEGIQVTGVVVQGIHYVASQGVTDPVAMAQVLGIPVGVVNYVIQLPVEEQAAIIQKFPAQA